MAMSRLTITSRGQIFKPHGHIDGHHARSRRMATSLGHVTRSRLMATSNSYVVQSCQTTSLNRILDIGRLLLGGNESCHMFMTPPCHVDGHVA